jgi:hypothetical protein
MIKWLKAATCALALLVCVALPTQARHHHGRHFRHGQRMFLSRGNSANPTPGIPRRVRRGRNYTPGVPRGPIGNRVGGPFIRNDRGHGHDHNLDEVLRQERDRDRDLGEAIGHSRGVGMGRGGGRGHGRRP